MDAKGCEKIVWRCVSRVRFGSKYCKHSDTVAEDDIHGAVMNAIMRMANKNVELRAILKGHIGEVLNESVVEDEGVGIRVRIAEIDAEFQEMLNAVTADMVGGFDEGKAQKLLNEKNQLREKLEKIIKIEEKSVLIDSRVKDICSAVDMLKNHPLVFDDELVRKMVECIIVESKERIKVVMVDGKEIIESLR